jgi:hypothetical protein
MQNFFILVALRLLPMPRQRSAASDDFGDDFEIGPSGKRRAAGDAGSMER